jgi:hypothetical protein
MEVLYVGITCEPSRRASSHAWWTEGKDHVRRYEVLATHPTRRPAEIQELDLIHEHEPIYNVWGNPRYRARGYIGSYVRRPQP